MISASCIICQDHFEGDSVISACPCGHTFHTDCLLKWLSNSATCPQCRFKTTHRSLIKLFFESGTDGTDVDPSKLKNDLLALQTELRTRDAGKSALLEENQRHTDCIKTLNRKMKTLTHSLQTEQTTCDALKKQLSLLSYQIDQAKEAKKETKKLGEKLLLLQRLQQVLSDNVEATEMLLSEYGDGPRAARELATYCVILKREFETNKLARRALKNELDATKKKLLETSKNLSQRKHLLENVENRLKTTEDDLRLAIEEKRTLKNRIALFNKTMDSPSGVSKSTLTRLIMESPMPYQFKGALCDTPKEGSMIDLDECVPPHPGSPDTPRLFDEDASHSTQAKRDCREFDLPYVKTTSMAHKNKKMKIQTDVSDAVIISSIANSILFTNRQPLTENQGALRKGYNGLGGHQTFYEPFRKPAMKTAILKHKKRKQSTFQYL